MNWICISSGNGLSPVRHQAITWTNASLLSIELLGTNLSEIRIGILSFSLKKMHLKLSSAKMAAILFRGDELKYRMCRSMVTNCDNMHIAFNTQHSHYSDVMSAMGSRITVISIVCSTVQVQVQIKENIKAPRHWPLWADDVILNGRQNLKKSHCTSDVNHDIYTKLSMIEQDCMFNGERSRGNEDPHSGNPGSQHAKANLVLNRGEAPPRPHPTPTELSHWWTCGI